MPYMVNANLFYGNIQYMMNREVFEELTADEQTALMEAAAETEAWLQPLYESWVDQMVGNAVMQGGGSAVSIPDDRRAELIASVQGTWDAEVDTACGTELAGQFRTLLAQHAP